MVDRRKLGSEAEEAAVAYLAQAGYKIRARNYFCRYGELDVVAEKDDLLCFVEVRMRSSAAWGDPSHTVMSSKQHRVVKSAMRYMFQERIRNRAVRFDVISIIGPGASAKVEHIPNAFDAGM